MAERAIRILVVGGNGFIGRHIVRHAAELGWEVTSLSLQSPDNMPLRQVQAVAADIADRAALREKLGKAAFEYVVNCGGYVDHTLFAAGGRKVIDAHFGGVLNLVEMLDRDVLRAFVNIGSSDEYGSAPAPQAEDRREAPISPYSLGKVAATHFLQMLHRTENFPATTLRLFLTYGPEQGQRRFLPQIIHGCLKGEKFPTSAGEQLRDFCFIQDVVDAVFAVFAHPQAAGEVINVASGQPVSIRRVIETVMQLVGSGEPQFGKIAYRPGENMELYASIDKAKALLGWEPTVDIRSGLQKTIQWIESQA